MNFIDPSPALATATYQAVIEELAKENGIFLKIDHPSLDQISVHAKDDERLAGQIASRAKLVSEQADPLLGVERAGDSDDPNRVPVLFCRRALIDRLVKAATGSDLAAIEQQIDAALARSPRRGNSPAGKSPAKPR